MYCQKCGKEIKDGAAFCTFCGNSAGSVGASTNVVSDGSKKKKEKSPNRAKKIETALVVILVLVLIISAARGTGNSGTDTAEPAIAQEAVRQEEAAESSDLNDIIGEWAHCVTVGSDSYAWGYKPKPYYLRVEDGGITAIDNTRTLEGALFRIYAIGVKDITIQEENGITYYIYSEKMHCDILVEDGEPHYERLEGEVGIRLHVDEETGYLVCEYNAPEDGYWQRVSEYEQVSSIEEHIDRFRTDR